MAKQRGLKEAIEKNDLKRVQALLNDGVPLNAALDGGYPALMVAAVRGSAKVVQLLLEAGAKPKQRCRPFQETALHFVTTPAAAEVLLDAGADIEAADKNGSRPLHAAVNNDLPAVVAILVERGADLNARCSGSGNTALHMAVQDLRPKLIQLLLQAGADPDVANKEFGTPLMAAANIRSKRALPVVKALLAGGATIDAAPVTGFTPLMLAAMNSERDLLRALIEAGAKLDATTKWKETALSLAITVGRTDMATILVAAGANQDIRISKQHPDARRKGKTARELSGKG